MNSKGIKNRSKLSNMKVLYNRTPLAIKIRQIKANDMTYIFGARCKDGVVLVGDTKVTVDDGTNYTYGEKISQPLNMVVIGSAGMGGLYKDCENRIRAIVKGKEREAKENNQTFYMSEEEFHVLLTKTIRGMHDDYGEDRHLILNNLMILSANRLEGTEAKLYAFHPYGFPEPVHKYRAIGHGRPYGELFLQKMWHTNKDMSMLEAVKLGCFIIKFIQDMKLDQSVGYSDEYLPQCMLIPDVPIPKEWATKPPPQEEIDAHFAKYEIRKMNEEDINQILNEVSSKISEFQKLFGESSFSL